MWDTLISSTIYSARFPLILIILFLLVRNRRRRTVLPVWLHITASCIILIPGLFMSISGFLGYLNAHGMFAGMARVFGIILLVLGAAQILLGGYLLKTMRSGRPGLSCLFSIPFFLLVPVWAYSGTILGNFLQGGDYTIGGARGFSPGIAASYICAVITLVCLILGLVILLGGREPGPDRRT